VSTTEAMELEFERTLDRYEADLMEALCAHFGVSTPEQQSEGACKAVNARWAKVKAKKGKT
jgi:hypothetical protein